MLVKLPGDKGVFFTSAELSYRRGISEVILPSPWAQDLPGLGECQGPAWHQDQVQGQQLPWPRPPARFRMQSGIGAVKLFRKLQLFCIKVFLLLTKQQDRSEQEVSCCNTQQTLKGRSAARETHRPWPECQESGSSCSLHKEPRELWILSPCFFVIYGRARGC